MCCSVRFLSILAVLLVALPASGQTKFGKLLKTMGVPHAINPDSTYRIYVDTGSEQTVVYASEVTLPQPTEKSPKLSLVYFHTMVCGEREDVENPPAQLKKMAELNARLLVGRLSIEPSDGAIYYSSWLWNSGINETSVGLELGLAHQLTIELKKALCSF